MENQEQRKREKPKLLTSTKDIKKLFAYLTVKRNQAIKELEQEFTFKKWRALLEFCLISCQVYNRRRAEEMERATWPISKILHRSSNTTKNYTGGSRRM